MTWEETNKQKTPIANIYQEITLLSGCKGFIFSVENVMKIFAQTFTRKIVLLIKSQLRKKKETNELLYLVLKPAQNIEL